MENILHALLDLRASTSNNNILRAFPWTLTHHHAITVEHMGSTGSYSVVQHSGDACQGVYSTGTYEVRQSAVMVAFVQGPGIPENVEF